MGDEALTADDGGRPLDDLLADGFDAARVQEIVDELPERRRAIVKLRYFLDCAPREIQSLLGIRERVYRRELERAMRQIAEGYQLVRDGSFCESRRSMVMAYVAGLSGPERARKAQAHIDSCPGCRAFAAQLRDAARDVAVALPLPVFECGDGLATRIADSVTAVRDQIADLTAGAKQHVLAATTRVDAGTAGMAGAVRPGTVAAAVAGCLALGGGATYCAVEGLPQPVRGLVTSEPKQEQRAQQPRRSPPRRQQASDPVTVPPAGARPASTTTPQQTRTTAAVKPKQTAKPKPKRRPTHEQRARAAARTAPAAPDPVEDEFGASGSGTPAPSSSSQPTASSSSGSSGGGSGGSGGSTPPPPPADTGASEFDP
jgi:hypothetical protein